MAVATKPRKQKKPKAAPPPPAFTFRTGARWPVKAQVAGEELAKLGNGDIGSVKPRELWQANQEEAAPLHPCFEWDDQRAGALHRDDQARSLIRDVRVIQVTADGEPEPVLRYVHVTLRDDGPAYVTTARAMNDEELRQQVLREALGLLNGIRERYRHLGELKDIFDAIDRHMMAD